VITGWFQFMELYGPPYGGSPTIEMDVVGHRLAFGSHTTATGYKTYWTSAANITLGKWENFVLHVNWSTDPKVGYVELWLNGVRQIFANGSTRVNFATFDPSINGRSDTVYINQYRQAGQRLGTVTIFQDNIRVGRTYTSVAR
jgi:hypothetical protein